ncbi:hypothetical protein GCM10011351_26680 [Paraliobacillus quinghaiensis]|uniref:Uncharacterized protein n=1 Tax=Paraliobacillus quinghaiensis TaxID=470815 RepID=A0A917TV17_9BACI|nr:hypothetical protein GCM10011351_26680 [Paraliobacillus quinghaiensis]
MKSGTSVKIKKNGRINKYYLFCNSCGCEYAFDENNKLLERTYFIKCYNEVKSLSDEIHLRNLEIKTGLSMEQIKRCFAYYRTRDVLSWDIIGEEVIVQPSTLNDIIMALKQKEKLNIIKKWNCFKNYTEYLTYRYHQDIVTILQHKYSKHKKVKQEVRNIEKVNEILKEMFTKDESITILSVCTKAGISPETARLWGWNTFIAHDKKNQKLKRELDRKNECYQLVDELLERSNRRITSEEIYRHLGVGRTVLWRFAPEVTSYITNRLKGHNKFTGEDMWNYHTKGE